LEFNLTLTLQRVRFEQFDDYLNFARVSPFLRTNRGLFFLLPALKMPMLNKASFTFLRIQQRQTKS